MLLCLCVKMLRQYLFVLAWHHCLLVCDVYGDFNQSLVAFGNSTTNTDTKQNLSDVTLLYEKTTVHSEQAFHHLGLSKCLEYGTCEFISTLPEGLRYCHCDSLCVLYKDCCSNVNTEQVVYPRNKNQAFPSCTQPLFSRHKFMGTFVVKSCPDSFTDVKIKENCSSRSIVDVGPWVASKANVVYQNRFCARCNGEFSFIPFNVNISSINYNFDTPEGPGVIFNISSVNLLKLFTDPDRKRNPIPYITMISPPGIEVRDCIMYDQYHQCDSNFSNPVALYRIVNGKRELFLKSEDCVATELIDYCFGKVILRQDGQTHNLFPLSALFQFADTNSLNCHREGLDYCLEDPVFANYEVDSRVGLEVSNKIVVSKPFLHQLGLVMHNILNNAEISAKFSSISYYSLPISNSTYYFEFDFYGMVRVKGTSGDMKYFDYVVESIVWQFIFTTPSGNVFEVKSNRSIIPFRGFRVELNHMTGLYTNRNRLNNSELPSYISIPRNNNRLCNEYLIESDLITEQFDTEFIVTDIKCPGLEEQNINIARTIVTYVGLFLSVIMLIVSVVLFRKAKMHKSVPGSNVENLCVSLILSNILFMVGIGANDYYWVCYCIGVALHYLLLVVFYFKTASLVYICFRMRNMLMNISFHKEMSSALKNTTVGYVFPLCFVMVAVLIDRFGLFGLNLQYSGTVCFPTGFPGSIFFVSIPIGLSVVTNIVCMTILVIILGRVSLDIQMVRKSSSYQFVFVIGRIAVVTGLFWIFGIVESVVRHTVTEYIFIIFCSFQGCLIALANLSTKRVYKFLK